MTLLAPVKGCIVLDTEGATGHVMAVRPLRKPVDAEIAYRNGEKRWRPLTTLRPDLKPGYHVVHCPPLGAGDPLGIGEVRAVRTLAGFTQVLVQFFDSGATCWLPWQTLSWAQSVEKRMERRAVGTHTDHADRFRLRILARALEIWDARTGAFGRLDIDPLPHQIHVAQKVVTSSSARWLIADDVGLGKTIEVGLILHALAQRNRCRRVLIVCPSGLVRQWKDEMRFKFDRAFEIYGRDFNPEYPEEMRARDQVIISLDLAKRDKNRDMLLAAGRWDVIVFDEAHRLGVAENGEQTARYRLAQALSARTASLLLLTATPHQGKSRRFGALLELVRPDLAEQIRTLDLNPEIIGDIIIRNRKTRVTDAQGKPLFNGHDTLRVKIAPSAAVRVFDQALQNYLRHGYARNAEGGALGRAIGFVMTTYRKLASSSIAAIQRALEIRLARLQGGIQKSLPDPDEIDENDDQLEESPGLSSHGAFFDDEEAQLTSLIRLAHTARGTDEKLQRFLNEILRPLAEAGQNLLIFSEYRATQDYLAQACARHFPELGRLALIHGSMSLEEKLQNVERFEQREARILISTEAGGEGLNLHRACHVMVNYDLPWNPARLVQRIGRLYRYGQTQRVQVINLQADDSFDSQALSLMLDRVQTMARDMAAVIPESSAALESEILGDLLAMIDMEEILERARTLRIELTESEIATALENARAAQEVEQEILQFADAQQGRIAGGLDARHMESFVVGMLPHIGARLRGRSHQGRVLEIELPEDMVGRIPGLGRRHILHMTAHHDFARMTRDILPLDFESHFVMLLADLAKDRRSFDGLYGETGDQDVPEALAVYQVRWQDLCGQMLEEELIPIRMHQTGYCACMADEDFAKFLLSPLQSTGGSPVLEGFTTAALESARDREIASGAKGHRFPSAVFLTGGLRALTDECP